MAAAATDSKCPKCSGAMIEHPSLLSMPLTSSAEGKAIEDQDADFIFKFISCRICGYSEFYLVGDGGSASAEKKRI
jgi:predicted nucleic-acid-binding Zn-ribbon protein